MRIQNPRLIAAKRNKKNWTRSISSQWPRKLLRRTLLTPRVRVPSVPTGAMSLDTVAGRREYHSMYAYETKLTTHDTMKTM